MKGAAAYATAPWFAAAERASSEAHRQLAEVLSGCLDLSATPPIAYAASPVRAAAAYALSATPPIAYAASPVRAAAA